jgi:RNA polymerase sigma-70 factor (ECF subfamily)
MDDAALVRRCLEGDKRAFDELVQRYRDRIYGMALHLLGDKDLAEDIAQEAFLRAFQRLTLFDPNKGSFSTWLTTLTTRLCLNALKRRGVEQQWIVEQEDETLNSPSWAKTLCHLKKNCGQRKGGWSSANSCQPCTRCSEQSCCSATARR